MIGTAFLGRFFLFRFAADVSAFRQFFPDLCQVSFADGQIQGRGNGFQMTDIIFGIYDQICQRLIGTFQFPVASSIFSRFLRQSDPDPEVQ